MKQIKIIALGGFLLIGAVLISGCDVNSVRSDIQKYIVGNQSAIDKAEELKNGIENYNPNFASEEEIETSDPIAKQVNELIKKDLGNVFTDSKLISVQNEGKTPFIMKYIAKRRINQLDGEALYKLLIESDSRVKDDAIPHYYDTRNRVEFSVYHDFGGRSYILAVAMDLGEQIIWVNVY